MPARRDAEHLAAMLDAARAADLPVVTLDVARITPDSSVEDYEREIAGLLASR